MKKLITLAVMLMLAASAAAQTSTETQKKPKGPFSFGVGYDISIFASETYKNDNIDRTKVGDLRGAHMITLNFDYAITPRWTVGLVTGATSYGVPVLFEAKHFWNDDVNRSRWLTYANAGVNFSGPDKVHVGMQGGIGGGYRFHIAPRFKIDLTAGYHFMQNHQEVMRPVGTNGASVEAAKFNAHAFSIGVGFVF